MKRKLVRVLGRPIFLVLLIAIVLRVWGIGFGLPFASARPDETAVAGPAVEFLSGDLRPAHFIYPTLFMYTVSATYVAYFAVTSPFANYSTLAEFAESRRQSINPFLLVSRSISALMGVLTVFWLFRLACRVTDTPTAILAAAFLAVSPLHVRDSHFGVTDVAMTGLIVLAVLHVVAWRQTGVWWRALVAGLIGGLAMSTKYNGLGVAVPFGVAAVLRLYEGRPVSTTIRSVLIASFVFTLGFAAGFFGGTPYSLIEWPRFLHDVTSQGAMFAAGHGIATELGWRHHALVTLPAALGWPMYLAAIGGVVGMLMTNSRKYAVVLAFPIAYYVVAGDGYTIFARYMIPFLPFACLASAWAAMAMVRAVWTTPAPQRAEYARIAVVGLLVAAPALQRAILIDHLLGRTDNRVVVADAIQTLIPSGSSVYHSGASYGHLPLPSGLRECTFDAAASAFSGGGTPDWIVLQVSPLRLYSDVPASLQHVIDTEYSLVRAFPVGDSRARVYDQQDAFFLPLTGLEGLSRPGPAFELYRRRGL